VRDETLFDAHPEHYLPVPDFRLPFTAYYANDLTHEGAARNLADNEAAGFGRGGQSSSGDGASFSNGAYAGNGAYSGAGYSGGTGYLGDISFSGRAGSSGSAANGDAALSGGAAVITEVFTEMLLDYGDTQSLPPLTSFVDLPDPLDPARHDQAETPDVIDLSEPALSPDLVNEGMEKPAGGLGNAAARGTGITLAMQCVRFVLQFCSLVVLARLLTPADFGIVAMVTAIVGVADIMRDFGLSSAAIQAKFLNNAERTNLFWVNVGIGCTGAVVILLCTPLIGRLYHQHHLAPIIFSLAWILIVSGVNTQFNAELSRSLRFKALAFADIGAQALGIGAAITVAVLGGGYWAIVVQQIVVAVMTLTFNMSVCRWRPGLPRRSVSITRFFRFGGGVFGTQLIAYATKNIDNVAVGAYWGAGPLGLYSRAYQLLMTPLSQINAPLTRVALPVLSRVQEDDVVFARYLKKAQLVGCYLTATVFAMCAALAHPMVAVLFGPKWSGVAPIFALLAIGGVFRSISQISYWIFLSRGKTAQQFKQYLVTRPIMIAIILGGLPWGPKGVAVGASIAYFMDWAVSLWWVGRAAHVDSRMLFRNAFRSLFLVSAPCGFVAYLGTLLVSQPIAQLAVAGAMAIVYIAVLITVVPTVRDDAQMIQYFVRRSIGRAKPKPRHRAAPQVQLLFTRQP
jgi:O-antigen/teichoic acid export membrane protein